VRFSEALVGEGRALYAPALAQGPEGVVAKHLASGLSVERNEQSGDGMASPPAARTTSLPDPVGWVEPSRPADSLPCSRVRLVRLIGPEDSTHPTGNLSWFSYRAILYPTGVRNRRIERANVIYSQMAQVYGC
jgi:hypothetical protein